MDNLEKFLEGKDIGWFSNKVNIVNISYGTVCYYISELNSLEIYFDSVIGDIFHLNISL